jgi:hypothetical protein
MIFLEQAVNQILKEEGQVIVSLEDLNITWEQIEALFIGVYEQAKQYISIYDWVEDYVSLSPTEREDYSHIRHITYKAYYQRFMPDLPQKYWEFNPYTKNISSLMNMPFSAEVGKYPTLTNLEYTTKLNVIKEKPVYFTLPCSFNLSDFKFLDFTAYQDKKEENSIILESINGVGKFNTKTLSGSLIMDIDTKGDLTVTSKYVGIKELDLTCELFYIWFKAALMQYIGSMKKQIDLTSVGLPFDFNADGLLERGRQLMDRVEELKGTKQHWSNF